MILYSSFSLLLQMTAEQCISIARAPSLASALDGVNDVLAHHVSSRVGTRPVLPAWLVLSVLLKVPTSQFEAFALQRFTLAQAQSHAAELGPLFMLLSAYWLAKHRMYAPLREVVLRILQYKEPLQAYQLSLFLRTLGQAAPSREVQHLMALLVDLAIKREFDLGVRTYRVLLENTAATAQVALLVERHMRRRKYSPNLSHRRAFVRIYGRSRRRALAARHWRRIRAGDYYGPKAAYTMQPKQKSRMLEDYLRAFRSPKKMNLYVKYLLKSTARAYEEPQDASKVPPPTLPCHDGIPHRVWLQSLRTAAETSYVSAEELVARFNAGKDHVGSPQKTLTAYFFVIKGLVRRAKHTEAVQFLEHVMPMQDQFDGPKLTMAVEALTMANKPHVALRLLLDAAHKQESTRPPRTAVPAALEEGAQSVEWKSSVYAPQSQLLDTRTVNSFMTCLLRTHRHDVVFWLWDTMSQVFGAEPDSATFAILLNTARDARRFEGALQVAIADFGMGRILPNRSTDAELHPQRLGRDEAVAGLERLLAPDVPHRVTGFWRGERAGDVALRVAWQVLIGNWPILATFSAPVRAIRRSAEESATSPIADLIHSFGGGNAAEREPGPARPYDEDGRTFFSIVPEDRAFRALIDLLAAEERAHQVPVVLVWMRYLRMRPSRFTLATALVYWGEVALEGPWVQRVRQWRARQRGTSDSEYMRLVKWLTKWLGRRRMPREEDKGKALRRIRMYRESEDPEEWGTSSSDDEWL